MQPFFEETLVEEQHHTAVRLRSDEAPRGLQYLDHARIGVGVGKAVAFPGVKVVPNHFSFGGGNGHARAYHNDAHKRLTRQVDAFAKDTAQNAEANKTRASSARLFESVHKALALVLAHARTLPNHLDPLVRKRNERPLDLLHHGIRRKKDEVVAGTFA